VLGHNSRVRRNDAHGNGYAQPADDFGIGVIGTATGNVVDENTVTGNTTGILVGAGARATLIRSNTVIGNPPIQGGGAGAEAVDILNLGPPDQTTFERNVCLTARNAPCSTTGGRPQSQ
jgi:parallel beta-helix repeat protein